MMRQREVLLDFRTPQHPSFGTNNWGGASPLLARNIPKEALEQRYLRLNTTRERDQVFPAFATTIEDEIFCSPSIITTIQDEIFSSWNKTDASKHDYTATSRRKWLLRKLKWLPPQKQSATLGSNSGSKWFPKWNCKKRWPNGWC